MVTRRNPWPGTLALAACVAAVSCAGLGDSLVSPEPPAEQSNGYLEGAGGPQTNIGLDGSEDSLLTRFQRILVENIVNVSSLPEREAFFLMVLPLKLVGGDGCPCRVVAMPSPGRKA